MGAFTSNSGVLSILNAQMTQPTTGSRDDDPVARLKLRLLERAIDGDSRTEDRSGLFQAQRIGDLGQIACSVSNVLLERSVHRICSPFAAIKSTVFAVETGIGNPLDADPVAHLDVLLRTLSECNHDTCAFVTADQRKLGWHRPVAEQSVQVRVAHSRV